MKKRALTILILMTLFVGGWAAVNQNTLLRGIVFPQTGRRVLYELGTNPYVRFYNTRKDQLWDDNASALGSAATVTWANSAVVMTDQRTTRGGWKMNVPSGLPNGWYDVTVYDNAAPASSDNTALVDGWHCYIQGEVIQSMNQM